MPPDPLFRPATSNDATAIAAIHLHPDRMGQGIGRILLAQAESGLVAQGFTTARLAVVRDNHPTRRFHERAGWTTDCTEVHEEVLGVPVIDLVYRKTLGDNGGTQ